MSLKFNDRIVDDSGYAIPVQGALVYLLNQDGTSATAFTPNPCPTDNYGYFTFTAPDGNDGVYRYEARVAGVTVAKGSSIIGTPAQFKGNPGGNVGSIGFAANLIDSMVIPDGVSSVNTGGFSVAGKGSARYVLVPSPVAAYPSTAKGVWWFTTNNGSKRWVLDKEQDIAVTMFGAVGDKTTDDAGAFEAARDFGAYFLRPRLFIPTGVYRWSRQLAFKNPIWWYTTAGVTFDSQYADAAQAYGSATIAVDAGVAGMLFYHDSDAATPSAYTGRKWQGAGGSRLDGLCMVGRDGGNFVAVANAIEIRCPKIYFCNMWIAGFGGDGIRVHATSDVNNISNGLNDPYGNANGCQFFNVHVTGCGEMGWRWYGRDANNMRAIGCEAQANGNWGVDVNCALGSRWAGDISTNNRLGRASGNPLEGSIRTRGAVSFNVLDVYIEPGGGALHDLQSPDTMIGEQGGAGIGNRDSTAAFVMANGRMIGKGLRHDSRRNSTSVRIGMQMGGDNGFGPVAMSFGSQYGSNFDSGVLEQFLGLNTVSHWWSLGNLADDCIQFPPLDGAAGSGYTARFQAPSLPNGFFFGRSGQGMNVASAAGPPAAGVGANGDFQFNTAPAVNAGKVLLGWSKIAGTWTALYTTTS